MGSNLEDGLLEEDEEVHASVEGRMEEAAREEGDLGELEVHLEEDEDPVVHQEEGAHPGDFLEVVQEVLEVSGQMAWEGGWQECQPLQGPGLVEEVC